MRIALATVAAYALTSCTGAQLFDCGEVDPAHLAHFVDLLTPEEAEVWARMDVHCVAADELDDFQRCGRSQAEHIGACTAWAGAGPNRGRCFVDRYHVVAGLAHEARHWSPRSWACPLEQAHTPACFDQALVDRSTP